MFATNIDAETTDEKVQALLDYLNEENGTKLKKRDIKIEEQPYSKSGALYHTPFGTSVLMNIWKKISMNTIQI